MVEEEGTAEVQHAVREADAVAAAELTYVEACSALVRMRAGKRLTPAGFRATRRRFEDFWGAVAAVQMATELIASAARLAEHHVLRAYDALQLAAVLSVREAQDVAFSCWDEELRRAAGRERLRLSPP